MDRNVLYKESPSAGVALMDARRAIEESWPMRTGRAHRQISLPLLKQVVQEVRARLSSMAMWIGVRSEGVRSRCIC
jgi:hypothetical protein